MTFSKFGFLLSGSGCLVSILCLLIPEFGDKSVTKEDIDKATSMFNLFSSIETK